MNSALVKTLKQVSESLERSFTVEAFSQRNGLLQRLDTRIRLLTILAMIISINLIQEPLLLAIAYLLALIIALLSNIPARFFLVHIWLPLPAIAALAAVPALFLTPGVPLFHLSEKLVITRNGMLTASILYLRVGASASLALLLMLTTRWADMLHALACLRIPDMLILVLGMTYRYIYVLLRKSSDMLLSRYSRTVGRLTPRRELAMEGAIAGTLFARSLEMSAEVYLAMQSRGFTGYARSLHVGRIGRMDYLWAAAVAMLCAAGLIVTWI